MELSPERAGWTYCGLRVAELPPGGRLDLSTGGEEMAVLPLSGSLEIAVEGRVLELEGRTGVFAKVTDWAYLPIATEATLRTPGGCRVALPSSRATRRLCGGEGRRRGRPGGGARGGPVHPTGHELHVSRRRSVERTASCAWRC